MQMMNCPHCGAPNSVKRDVCYQCSGDLRGQPSKVAGLDYMPTCKDCSHAGIFPPAGQRISAEQVWCMLKDVAVGSTQMAGDCYEEAFAWKREDILD
ncbi:MAG: hypothetical protein ACE149_03785 [Armatimonadota bacterium]